MRYYKNYIRIFIYKYLFRNIYSQWQTSEYKAEKLLTMKDEINRVESYKPILDNIVICGKSYDDEEERVTAVTPQIEDEKNLEVIQETSPVTPVFCINGYNVYGYDTGRKEIRISYDHDHTSERVYTENLNLINKSNGAIRIKWKRFKRPNLFKDLIKEQFEEDSFVFNKNFVVIIPGEELQCPIHFKPLKMGRFEENWKLIFSPPIAANLEIIIHLVGVSYDPDIHYKCHEIDGVFETKLKKRVIEEAINETIDYAVDCEKPIVYTYNKIQLFEATNSFYDPGRPTIQYLYDSNIVRELTQFYDKVKLPHHPKTWNLNIQSLQFITEEREAYEKTKLYKELYGYISSEEELSSESESDIDLQTTCGKYPKEKIKKDVKGGKGKKDKSKKGKPKKEKAKKKKEKRKKTDKKKKGKGKMEREQTDIEADTDIEEEEELDKGLREKYLPLYKYRLELNEILLKLRKTTNFRNENQRKYAFAHSLFVSGMNNLCHQLDKFHRRLNINPPSRYPHINISHVVKNSERLTFERFEEVFKPSDFYIIPLNLKDRPPPDILNGIPFEDCDRRYRAYFNLPEETEKSRGKTEKGKKGKGKKDKKDKPDKNNKKEKKDKKDKKNKKEEHKKDAKTIKIENDDDKINDDDEKVACDALDLDFDPYKKFCLRSVLRFDDLPMDVTKDSPLIKPELKMIINYRYNLYILFYTILNDIIMNIIDFFEDNDTTTLPPHHIKEVESCYNLMVSHRTDTNTKLINLDVIITLLNNEDDLAKIKEELTCNVKRYVKEQIKIPKLPSHVGHKSMVNTAWHNIRLLEERRTRISNKMVHKFPRRHVPSADRIDRYVLSYDLEPEPLKKEIDAQTDEDDVEEIIKIEEPNVITEVEEKMDNDDNVNHIKKKESSIMNLNKELISCVLWKCSQHAKKDRSSVASYIDSKTNLIDKVLWKMHGQSPDTFSINEKLVLEVCDVMRERGLLNFDDGDGNYVELEEKDDNNVYYDSNDDDD